jgi:FHA domain-containing protein
LTVETGLLLAEGALLLLLFLFVWMVVRSASGQLKKAPPSMGAPASPAIATDTDPHLALEDPEPAPLAPEPAPVLSTIDLAADVAAPPDLIPLEHLPADPTESPAPAGEAAAVRRRARARSGFNLTDNVRPRLVVTRSPSLASGTEIALDGGITIGRSRGSELPIADAYVSHTHARVFRRGQFFFIEDLGSSNGTFLNGTRIGREAQLKVLDELRMGETVLRYEE